MNEFLARLPFDLYELSLFHLVVEEGNFTKAGQKAGLTQSAMTRQIRGIEDQLGVSLFERTTRSVRLTRAGTLLYEKSGTILRSANEVLQQVQRDLDLVPPQLRVGVSRGIGMAHLPGFFFAYQRKFPKVHIHVEHLSSGQILAGLENQSLDVGLVCPPPQLPRGLHSTYQFRDEFVLIAPPKFRLGPTPTTLQAKNLPARLFNQRWLLIEQKSNTGRYLRKWLRENGWNMEPAMELDSFDLIVNLVSLGMGVSFVPHRVLPIYAQRRAVQRIPVEPRFSRELVVVIRKSREHPAHVTGFVENVLF
jgi:DNA-binding transcriptional LysR family regulator